MSASAPSTPESKRKRTFDEKLSRLQRKVDGLKEELVKINEKRQIQKERLNDVEISLQKEEEQVNKLRKKVDELKPQSDSKAELTEEIIASKQADLEKQQRRRGRLESKLKRLEKKVHKLQSSTKDNEEDDDDEGETKITQLNEQISEELEKQDKLKEQILALQNQLDELSDKKDDEGNELNQEVLQLLSAKLETESKANSQLLRQKEELERQVKELEKLSASGLTTSVEVDLDEVQNLVEQSKNQISKINSLLAKSHNKKATIRRAFSSSSLHKMTLRGPNKILKDILSISDDQANYLEDEKVVEEHQYAEDSSGDIVFNSRRTQILGGTLEKIIELITSGHQDENLVKVLLISYNAFSDTATLLDKLIARVSSEALDKDCKHLVMERVANLLQIWVEYYPHEWRGKSAPTSKVLDLVKHINGAGLETQAASIHKSLTTPKKIYFKEEPPKPIMPKSDDFTDFDPLEVARQMTIVEYDMYNEIQPKEFLGGLWTKANKNTIAPNLSRFIARFNTVSSWVQGEIVVRDKPKDRILIVKKFIKIAKHCRELNNYNGILEILTGLHSAAIGRLKNTFKKLEQEHPDTWGVLRALEVLMDNSDDFRIYKQKLDESRAPCIPYLGPFLRELTYIEDTHFSNLEGRTDMINLEKYKRLAFVIREVLQYQNCPYNLLPEASMLRYLSSLPVLAEEELWRLSLICEPKEDKKPNRKGALLGKNGTTL